MVVSFLDVWLGTCSYSNGDVYVSAAGTLGAECFVLFLKGGRSRLMYSIETLQIASRDQLQWSLVVVRYDSY